MTSQIKIAGKEIGTGQPAFVIAEIGQAHEGSFGMARAYIEAVAKTGADAVKFQTHIAAAESTRDDPFRVPIAGYVSRYEYWQAMEFTFEQWCELAALARDLGLVFMSSAFSVEAVELLSRPEIDMPAWKVGSGEFRSVELLDAMIKTGKPVLLSTGMSTYDEIDQMMAMFKDNKVDCGIFQCTSKYPTALEDIGLNVLDEFREKYGCPVGLSDHSAKLSPNIAAIARGAEMIEVHVTFSRDSFGPDAKASLTLEEMKVLCDFRDDYHVMASHKANKDDVAREMDKMRTLFSKSIGLARDVKAGEVLIADLLTPKKPASGIAWDARETVIGKKALRDLPHDRLLKEEDIGDE
jgi:N-acetylneuraminate synthase